MSRAMLTGALVGAQIGLSGIPQRFIEGLTEEREIVDLAQRLKNQGSPAAASWGYEDGHSKGPGPPLLVTADF